MRYELADYEWIAIKPMLPNKPRGVPRVNDRRVASSGFSDQEHPGVICRRRLARTPLATTASSGGGGPVVWGRIIEALANAHDTAVQMIDTSIVRVHQHGACITRNQRQSMGRSRGGLTSKIHAGVDGNGLPVRLALSPGGP
jgi:transposase